MSKVMTLEDLLSQADNSAKDGRWDDALDALLQAIEFEPQNSALFSTAGTCLVQLGRTDDAEEYIAQAAKLAPDSAEIYQQLGIVRMLAGAYQGAISAFQQAIELDGDHPLAWKYLAAAYQQAGLYAESAPVLAALVANSPQDVDALFMLGRCYELAQEYSSARDLYRKVLAYAPDHSDAKEGIARIPQGDRDLSRIARPEHASKLVALKGLRRKRTSAAGEVHVANKPQSDFGQFRSIAFYGPAEVASEVRLGPLVRSLAASGLKVTVSANPKREELSEYDAFFFANPHTSSQLVDAFQACVDMGKRIILDLDRDFHAIPEDQSPYLQYGRGNPKALALLEQMLSQADVVTMPSSSLAEHYRQSARRVAVLPYSWNKVNEMWSKPSPPRKTINLGLVGLHTSLSDLEVLGRSVRRILRKLPNVLLVFGGDLTLYNAFANIPEDKKLYLPPGRLEDYPYMLAQLDVILLPLQLHTFNQSKSDLALMEAGARGIPWVATPIPAYHEWKAGGVFAENPEDWFHVLQDLCTDKELRQTLGKAGQDKAREREVLAVQEQFTKLFQ